MKIKLRKIQKGLRIPAFFLRLCIHIRDEQSFSRIQPWIRRFVTGQTTKKLQCEERFLPRKDGSLLRLCLYRSLTPKEQATAVLWIHGGGYAIGTPEQDIGYAKKLIGAANCVLILPDYTLSIDAPYPAALEDCYATLLWVKDHATELGIRNDQIFVGGESAGGGLTAALSAYARDKGEVSIAFQMPLYPMMDDRHTLSSSENDAPVCDSKENEIAWKLYLGSLYGTDQVSAYAAPARLTDYSALPPTYTFIGDIEVFYNETLHYIEELQKAGIPAEVTVYPGCFHAFDMFFGQTKIGKRATKRLLEEFVYATKHYYARQPE